jgi:hypothetical protein
MRTARLEMFKLLISVGLLAAAGLAIIRSGLGLLSLLLAVSGLSALMLWFARSPRPEEELPCASVSCCHFLGDHENEHKKKPQE